jgi:predicted metal-dependent hydrolase
MTSKIEMGDFEVDVTQKDIKNVHLSVYPPNGAVRISAPLHLKLDAIRVFAISKLGWIRKQQKKIRGQVRETKREYLDRESHYYMGKCYLIEVVEENNPPNVQFINSKMVLNVRPGADEAQKKAALDGWYRQQLKIAIPPIIEKWEKKLNVSVAGFVVRKMKTRWGSCTPARRTIRFNLELAKKPPECLEYIAVHELMHLIESSHNNRFQSLMSEYYPKWKYCRDELNRLPVKHEDWSF